MVMVLPELNNRMGDMACGHAWYRVQDYIQNPGMVLSTNLHINLPHVPVEGLSMARIRDSERNGTGSGNLSNMKSRGFE